MNTSEFPTGELAFDKGTLLAFVDLRVYRLSAVQKVAYRLADRCTVKIGLLDIERLPLTFLFSPKIDEAAAREIVRLFFQELLDQELRERVREETAPLRALLLAQAFSKTDLIQR